jgi:hypothetical protein
MNLSRPRRSDRTGRRSARTLVALAALGVAVTTLTVPSAAQAASSEDCTGGGFALVLPGRTVAARPGQDLRTTVRADQLGTSFLVRGRYVEFTVQSATLGVTDWTLTGAPSPGDLTGGRRTPVFAAKTPDLRGSRLTSGMEVRLRDGDLRLIREGSQVEMKIQAKDCSQGGIFQMEPEREDGTATVFTHTLAPSAFYYDNPRFRERIGTTVPFVTDTGQTVQMPVTARVNFGSITAPRLVGRDSAQVATRIAQCSNVFGTHCGGVSKWSVASGGRMGQVMGEDATEVSPAATDCVQDCQAQNQVNGRAVVLGFPSPVPAGSLLTPRTP